MLYVVPNNSYEGVDSIHLEQERGKQRAHVNTVMNIQVKRKKVE
jgi:hypothetical protein